MPSRRPRLSVLFVALLLAQPAAQAAEKAPLQAENNAPPPASSATACPSGMVAGAGRSPPPALAANALAPPPISPTMPSNEMAAALDRYLSELAAKDDFSGTVLVAKSGKALFERS